MEVDAQIRAYEATVTQHPNRHPVYCSLAAAYLQKARDSHDPAWLAKARAALERSRALQPSYEALRLSAAIANFSHRFEEGLAWARQAQAASWVERGSDPQVLDLLVEAHLGLGQPEEAARLLPAEGAPLPDFHTAAAVGRYHVALGEHARARPAYAAALEHALKARVPLLAAWAEVRLAGTYIDSGQAQQARPHLVNAQRHHPAGREVRMHWAEVHEAQGRPTAALALYEALLSERVDPGLSVRAARLARELGAQDRAQHHFAAAEAGLRTALEAGEVYPLGELALLYAEAGVHLERAHTLATRNLEYRRDREAHQVLSAVRARLGRPAVPAPAARQAAGVKG